MFQRDAAPAGEGCAFSLPANRSGGNSINQPVARRHEDLLRRQIQFDCANNIVTVINIKAAILLILHLA
jgi:hypothetical protein